MIKQIPPTSKAILIFTHGAGAGMNHSFMETIAHGLVKENIGVVRFNFPYLEEGRRAPGKPSQAINSIVKHYDEVNQEYNLPLFIGGKSYGGRMASHAMAENKIPEAKGLVYFGFPLHTPGKESLKRAEHLYMINTPMLFLQGDKDKLADKKLINDVASKIPSAKLVFYEDADHSFKVPKKAKLTQDEVYSHMVHEAANWMKSI